MLYCLFVFASPIAREISQRFTKRDLRGVYGSGEYWEGLRNRALQPIQNGPCYNPQDGKWYDENGLEDGEFEFDDPVYSGNAAFLEAPSSSVASTVKPKKKDVGLICHEPGCKAEPFSQPYDLTRHMKTVHLSSLFMFPDYKKIS